MQLLDKLLESKTSDIFGVIENEIPGEYVASKGNGYLFYRTASPLLFMAHIDTVGDTMLKMVAKAKVAKQVLPVTITVPVASSKASTPKVVWSRNIARARGSILGADDRAGVYAILELVRGCIDKRLPLPNLLFTDGEECGGIGMDNFLSEVKDFEGIRLALAMDRQGCGEYVVYNGLPSKVEMYIESFGFMKATGTYSDISDFVATTRIPGVNLSVGYHFQHTIMEELHLDEMYITVDRAIEIVADPIGKLHKVSKNEAGYKWNDYHYYTQAAKSGTAARETSHSVFDLCEMCGREVATEYNLGYLLCRYCLEELEKQGEDAAHDMDFKKYMM